MESIRIPFIKDLSRMDDRLFLLKMEENGARILVADTGCRDALTMVLEVLRNAQ